MFMLFFAHSVYSHDTLKFVKSYVLYKVPTVFVIDISNDVCIPVQYHNLNKKRIINYKKRDKCDEEIHYSDDYLITIIGTCDTLNIDSTDNKIELNDFTDTVYIKRNELADFTPYIKTKSGNLNFVDFHIILIKDSIAKNLKIKNLNSGRIFEYVDIYDNTVIVLKKIYYRNKEAVYMLNRQFVIIVK